MAKWLRQSTASQEIVIGRMVDATDGNTAETGLTIANTDIDLWKHGATTLADKNSGGGTHIAGGLYSAVLDATDTNTLGNLKIFVQVAGDCNAGLTTFIRRSSCGSSSTLSQQLSHPPQRPQCHRIPAVDEWIDGQIEPPAAEPPAVVAG